MPGNLRVETLRLGETLGLGEALRLIERLLGFCLAVRRCRSCVDEGLRRLRGRCGLRGLCRCLVRGEGVGHRLGLDGFRRNRLGYGFGCGNRLGHRLRLGLGFRRGRGLGLRCGLRRIARCTASGKRGSAARAEQRAVGCRRSALGTNHSVLLFDKARDVIARSTTCFPVGLSIAGYGGSCPCIRYLSIWHDVALL